MTRREQLILVDGHALAFRAFHALADSNLRSSTGEPTYAVFGFTQIVLTALQERKSEYVAVSFDIGRTFRDDLYSEYKAGRAETPAEFEPQLARIKEVLNAFNIPIYTAEGYEADDVIGTLARQATAQGVDTLILTGDTDTLQLVDDNVHVLLAVPFPKGATKEYGVDTVLERYKGLRPDQLADLRGLKGDTSDNIPGVKGIGEAGAISLLNTYGSVEKLYDVLEGKVEHPEPIPNRYRKHLTGQRESAEQSKHLATIVCEVPGIELDLQAAALHDYDRNKVIALFQQFEFGANLIKKLPGSGSSLQTAALPTTLSSAPVSGPANDGPAQLSMFDDIAPVPLGQSEAAQPVAIASLGDYQAVTTLEQFNEMLKALEAAPGFAFDTETDSLRSLEAGLVGISLSVRSGSAWYIPIGHSSGEQLERQFVLDGLRPFFSDPNKARYGHNAKFDIEVLQHAGIEVPSVAFDTMVAAALLNKRQGLKDLSFYELGLSEPPTSIDVLIGKGKNQITFDQVPIEQATPYAASDADMTFRLYEKLSPQLASQDLSHVLDIFTKLEMPLIPVLVRMETAGIGLDIGYLKQLNVRITQRLHELEETMTTLAGEPFNINSGKQLNQVLFGKLGLKTDGLSKLKNGEFSITADVLEKLSHEENGDVPRLILQARQLAKLKSTYIDALPDLINTTTGRIHTTYNQVGAATGRLSSNDPNLQNIPVRTQEGREIRRAFVAQPGHRFIAADYSQIELRVLAHITKDPGLVQVFMEGQDVHAATASQIFDVPIEQVDKNQRRIAKMTVFGIIYGISSFGLAQRTDLSRTQAQELINALFERFPGLRNYIDQTLDQARSLGYVNSLFGRRRNFQELKDGAGAPQRRQAAEREAINAPIQSTSADIMKIAMINIDRELQERKLGTKLLLQVHDELIFEAPEDELEVATELVRTTMEQAYSLDVPLKVDVEIGQNWEEMTEVE
jgi:DNA polymerase-1